jgi:hypothetical protein
MTMSQLAGIGGLVSAGMGAMSQYNAGQAQQMQLDMQAKNEQIRANEESIQRRERLLDSLAMQSARTGAGGVKQTSGTAINIQETDIGKFEREQRVADVSTKMSQKALKMKGKSAARSARLSAGMSLLDGVTTYARTG